MLQRGGEKERCTTADGRQDLFSFFDEKSINGKLSFAVKFTQLHRDERLRVGRVPREQNMSKGHLPRVM